MAKKAKDKKKKKMGRPVKYKARYCNDIIRFFSVPAYEQFVYEVSKEYFANGVLKKESQKKKPLPNKMPTFFGFARKIGVNQETITEWVKSKKYPDFSVAYKACKELQKEFLINNGLSGASPSPAYIFTAKNVTDMRDKVEVANDVTTRVRYINMPKPYDRGTDGYTVVTPPGTANNGAGV